MATAPNKIIFTGSQGDELAARLDLPVGEPRALAVFAHCFTCGKDIAAASRISAGLVAEGFGVLRFDFTGLGSSEGEFANTDFSSNVADLEAAADMLRERYEAPRLLVGHSLGGSAVLAVAGRIPEVRAVATIAAPADPVHVSGVFSEADLETIKTDGEAEVSLAGRPFRVRQQFLDDISARPLEEAIKGLDAALLVMHSPIDELVGIDHARQIYQHARHPKSFVSLDGANHLLTNHKDSAYAARLLATWASRYVGEASTSPEPTKADPPRATVAPADGEVIVEERDPDGFAQTISAGTHTFIGDEPKGTGDDTGPNPYEYLLAALGTCTSMTIRMYARRKKIPLEHVRVTLHHERTHAEDCERSETETCKVEVLHRRIELTGNLDDAQQADLMRIADRCPVHRTLEGTLRVDTEQVGV